MPAPIENAVCGPQKPGTPKPPTGTNLADLNPCPLNACCNVWGQCGTTADFCTKSSLGPPGTSEPGKNGCISNCGTEIVNNGQGPAQFIKIGYFEAWNKRTRACLNMDVTQIDPSYTHIHFSFGDVTSQFTVAIEDTDQFNKFIKMKGPKRVLAFGGWTASTSPSSYWIFREGVKPGNRETLATNLANFIHSNNLDGLDLDWEYPGAPDIPGIPAADPIDGAGYLELLKLLRARLPNKSLSIAAPASYWYLKQFPINEIAKVVDYIVYMTYDLHGQWDYNNQWSNPGCPKGNCLRSHVNFTETINALSMVTKAGVPSYKLILGVTSYGRAFRMTDPGCTGPMCTFVGPQSAATKGECTDTAGYIANAEIDKIIANGGRTYYDTNSQADILIYGSDWVAYMSDRTKATRIGFYKGLKFGGTSDWAVDLAKFMPEPGEQNPIALPIEEDWRKIKCSHPLARDEEASEIKRWDELKCKDVWDSGISRWNDRGSTAGGLGFVAFLSNHWGGPPEMHCGVPTYGSACGKTVECLGADLTRSPGGALILRGMQNLHDVYLNFYTGVVDAGNTVSMTLSDFSETFAPPEEEDDSLDWLFAFLGAGLGMAGGPVFEKVFTTTKFFSNPNTQQSLQEVVMTGVDMGLEKASDAIKKGSVLKPMDREIANQLSAMVMNWKELTNSTMGEFFAGDEKGITALFKMINQNKMLNAMPQSVLDMEQTTLRALYASLIPYSWKLRDSHAVLVDTGFNCDDVGSGDYKYMYPDNDKAAACVDGKKYFLLNPKGDATTCRDMGNWAVRCEEHAMTALPGFDSLGEKDKHTGRVKWGGITREDIARSILTRFDLKGNKDLDKPIDLGNEGGRSQFWEQVGNGGDIVRVPGVVQIPKCGPEEILDNWKRKTVGQKLNHIEYPCNKS
ncbi:glycoside hydrolase [Westerdykella ornata]|uniref:chitinase n=1 Tax=Westerdykella ornata TaxID=318751 RepID=A0A6A6JJ04_WESOR|nr:glycoside hydrolase [Westerdykella ornata]KAF2275938.1 glycoside hydrolase [Westerdykella ornata]